MKFCMACGAPVEFDDEKFCCKCRFVDDKQYQREVRRRFGERLKAAREKAGLSRKNLADKLNLTVVGYGLYERGERELTILAITRIARTLKISLDWLFGIEETDNERKRQTT